MSIVVDSEWIISAKKRQKWNTVMHWLPRYMGMCWPFHTSTSNADIVDDKKTAKSLLSTVLCQLLPQLDTELPVDSDMQITKNSAVIAQFMKSLDQTPRQNRRICFRIHLSLRQHRKCGFNRNVGQAQASHTYCSSLCLWEEKEGQVNDWYEENFEKVGL